MKTLIIIGLLLSGSCLAQDYSKRELIKMSTSSPSAHLAPEVVREWNRLFDVQNLRRDFNKTRNDWTQTFPISRTRTHHIEGKRIYYGFIPKSYRYDIIEDSRSNELIVNVKMHFYPSKTYLRKMKKAHRLDNEDQKYYPALEVLAEKVRENVQEAQARWNKEALPNVRFKFEVVKESEKAHYSIKLTTIFGAVYDKWIMAPASPSILTHEMGHMMGLDDEYSLVTNTFDFHTMREGFKDSENQNLEHANYKDMRCQLDSMMCLREKLYPYHFDHILGRLPLE